MSQDFLGQYKAAQREARRAKVQEARNRLLDKLRATSTIRADKSSINEDEEFMLLVAHYRIIYVQRKLIERGSKSLRIAVSSRNALRSVLTFW